MPERLEVTSFIDRRSKTPVNKLRRATHDKYTNLGKKVEEKKVGKFRKAIYTAAKWGKNIDKIAKWVNYLPFTKVIYYSMMGVDALCEVTYQLTKKGMEEE